MDLSALIAAGPVSNFDELLALFGWTDLREHVVAMWKANGVEVSEIRVEQWEMMRIGILGREAVRVLRAKHRGEDAEAATAPLGQIPHGGISIASDDHAA